MKAALFIFAILCTCISQTPEPSSVPGPQPYGPEPSVPEPSPNQPEPTPSNQTSEPSPQPYPDPYHYIYNWVEIVLRGLLILIGLIWVVCGYRFMFRPRLTLFQAGFIIFYFIAFQLLVRFTVTPHLIERWLAYTLAGVAGLVGAAMFLLSVHVGRFFFSALTGVLLTTLIFAYTPLGTVNLAAEYKLAIIGGVGVILGLVSLKINKLIPIVGYGPLFPNTFSKSLVNTSP
jgi:hypothetical protein